MTTPPAIPTEPAIPDGIDPELVDAVEHALAAIDVTSRARLREPWPLELHDLGYRVWGFLADRDMPRTRDILISLFPQCDALSVRLMQRWRQIEGWPERADRELANLAPHLHAAVQRKLLLASVDAATTLHEAVRGNLSGDGRMVANRITAARDILDRTGHPRMTEVATLNVRVTAGHRYTVEQLMQFDADQLAAIAAGEIVDIEGTDVPPPSAPPT